jgi:hypothetical protein
MARSRFQRDSHRAGEAQAPKRRANGARCLDPQEMAGTVDDVDPDAGKRSAASVDAASGIGLREPCTKPTGTRWSAVPPRGQAARRESSAPSLPNARWTAAARGSAGRPPDRRSTPARRAVSPRAPAPRAAAPCVISSSSTRARSRTASGVRRSISWSNSGQRPSPTEPSGSTASTPRSPSGSASATCRASCPPHEWPTTYACSQASASSTRRASSTSAATVNHRRSQTGRAPAADTSRRRFRPRAPRRARGGTRSRGRARRAAAEPAASTCRFQA